MVGRRARRRHRRPRRASSRSSPGGCRDGRRYGVVAGTGRLLDAIGRFRFGDDELERLARRCSTTATLDWLRRLPLRRRRRRLPRGRAVLPRLAVLTVARHRSPTRVVLETLALSVLNHDCAVAAAAARMVTAAAGRPLIEMGSRRTHEEAAVAAARAPYLAGFAATSNLEAGRRYGIPTAGTAAHAYILLHDDELAAFRGAGRRAWARRPRCWSTPTTSAGASRTRSRSPGPELGAVRIDSGDLGVLARQAREQLDGLGATGTRIVLSGDLDEYAIARCGAEPVDALRRRHVGGHRLGRADREHGLQAGRGRRAAGRQAQRVEGVPRRGEVGGAPVQADRHGGGGGRAPRATPPELGAARPGGAGAAAARRRSRWTTCRRWSSRASTCARRWSRCRGRASSSPAASPRSRPSTEEEPTMAAR